MDIAIVIAKRSFRAGITPIQVFAGTRQKASRTTRRVTHIFSRLRVNQLNHAINNMPRGTKLTVNARRGQFTQQVFVNIAFDIALRQRQLIHFRHRAG